MENHYLITELQDLHEGKKYYTMIQNRLIEDEQYFHTGEMLSEQTIKSIQDQRIKETLLLLFTIPVIIQNGKLIFDTIGTEQKVARNILKTSKELEKALEQHNLPFSRYQENFKEIVYSILSLFQEEEGKNQEITRNFTNFTNQINALLKEDISDKIEEYNNLGDETIIHPIELQYKKGDEIKNNFLNTLSKENIIKLYNSKECLFHNFSDIFRKYIYSIYKEESDNNQNKEYGAYKNILGDLQNVIEHFKEELIKDEILEAHEGEILGKELFKDISNHINNILIQPENDEDIFIEIDNIDHKIIDPFIRKVFQLEENEDTGIMSRIYGNEFSRIADLSYSLLHAKNYNEDLSIENLYIKLMNYHNKGDKDNIISLLYALNTCSLEELLQLPSEYKAKLLSIIIEYEDDNNLQRSSDTLLPLCEDKTCIESIINEALESEKYKLASVLRDVKNNL